MIDPSLNLLPGPVELLALAVGLLLGGFALWVRMLGPWRSVAAVAAVALALWSALASVRVTAPAAVVLMAHYRVSPPAVRALIEGWAADHWVPGRGAAVLPWLSFTRQLGLCNGVLARSGCVMPDRSGLALGLAAEDMDHFSARLPRKRQPPR